MFGLFQDFTPKFCKQYANLSQIVLQSLEQYKSEVDSRSFPASQHMFKLKTDEWERFKKLVNHQETESSNNTLTASQAPSSSTSLVNPINVTDNSKTESPFSRSVSTLQISGSGTVNTSSSLQNISVVNNTNNNNNNHNNNSLMTDDNMKKKIVIIGGGSMGSLITSRFAKSQAKLGNCVWMLTSWREHTDIINNPNKGLSVHEIDGTYSKLQNIIATGNPVDVVKDGIAPDIIIILVKSPNTKQAALSASILIGDSNKPVTVITMQNGFGNVEILKDILANKKNVRIMQSVTDQGAMIMGPGEVCHTGIGTTTIAGNPNSEEDIIMFNSFLHTGMDTKIDPNLESVTWGKLVVNAAINPLTALLNLENGQLITHPKAREMLKRATDEVVCVAKARGIKLPYEDALAKVESVAMKTAQNKSSMLVDVLRGEQTEIDSINGFVVREGEKLGVDVSFNKNLLKQIQHCTDFNQF
eukprot:TRINITY_DN242_c1_g1_i3.p1 TRINITY_DN242_c1_g1~~TRINITY_DN242_c1_g1_i3.p1  ORF type:complete len:472 (-),score=107.31 TRINITY_DN242_c1_g1_i3:157-1572(-)